ncbi:RES family NAD+ phosphorylase [Halarcobacter ebronensis]|uniref:RES family NAD+ phosphorylase n=1 Tax=Halarcobacter ebronensis TaxID=1462615 RepID=UPI003C745C00
MMVCNYCFDNEKIQNLIVSLDIQADDSYVCTCGMQNDEVEEIKLYLMDKEELTKFLIDIIHELYIHENTHGMGMSARSIVEGDEDPFEFAGLSDLYDVCESLFGDNLLADFIIENKPYVDIPGGEEDLFESAYYRVWQHRCFFERDDEDEFGLSNWEVFCKNVKHKARYFDHGDFSVTKTLENFSEFFEQITIKNPNNVIYRARKIYSEEEKNDIISNPSKELGKVPIEYAKTNRFSPIGISYGYFAYDEETVLKEIRSQINDEVAVGKFSLESDLKIIDFRRNTMKKEFLDYFSDNFNGKFYCIEHIISEFILDISRPISDDNQLLEYIPTQIMSEYIWSKGYDGFLFDSSVNTSGGTNLVLFEEKYKFVEFKRKKIIDISMTTEVLGD